MANLVAAFQKTDRLEVFPPAEAVREPLAGFARIVEVKHRRHGIHAQAVDVVFVEPEKRVADQEVFHLAAAVVENECAPVLMLAEAGILVLVERAAVVAREAVGVLREMPGHPIENHADAGLVTAVHEIPKLVGISEAARRRVVVHHLIAPGAVERMLHHRHQLDVGESHFLHIRDESVAEFAVAEEAVAILGDPLPRPDVDLVDAHRAVVLVDARAAVHPVLVTPLVAAEVENHAAGLRSMLGEERVGIGLQKHIAVLAANLEFVVRALVHAGEKDFPNARRNQLAHRVRAAVPVVEVADHAHALGGRRPDREMHARHLVYHFHMGAEFFVDVVVRAFVEKIDVHLAEHGAERVGVALAPLVAVMRGEFERIALAGLVAFDLAFKNSLVVEPLQRLGFRVFTLEKDRDLGGIRTKHAPDPFSILFSDSQNAEGIAVAGFDERVVVFVWEQGRVHAGWDKSKPTA